MKKAKTLYISRTGVSHIKENRGCDDALFISSDETVIVLCDGVSNSDKGGEGARTLAKEVGNFLLKNKYLLELSSVSNIRQTVYSAIKSTVDKLCNIYNITDRSSFASTFLALVRTSEQNITVLHCADGAVAGAALPDGRGLSVITTPENNGNAIYPADHPIQATAMRVVRLNPSSYSTLLLGTDGFTDVFIDSYECMYIPQNLRQIMSCKTTGELNSLVDHLHIGEYSINDDITAILYNVNGVYADNDPVPARDTVPAKTPLPAVATAESPAEVKPSSVFSQPKTTCTLPQNNSCKKESFKKPEENSNRKRKKQVYYKTSRSFIVFTITCFALCIFSILQLTSRIKQLNSAIISNKKEIAIISQKAETLEYRLNDLSLSVPYDTYSNNLPLYFAKNKKADEIYTPDNRRNFLYESDSDNPVIDSLDFIYHTQHFTAGSSLNVLGSAEKLIELAELNIEDFSNISSYLDGLNESQKDLLSYQLFYVFKSAVKIIEKDPVTMRLLSKEDSGEYYTECDIELLYDFMSDITCLLEEKGVEHLWRYATDIDSVL